MPSSSLAAWIALLVLLSAELMNILDQSVVLTALPAIQESTGAGQAEVQWLTTGYSLPVAAGLIAARVLQGVGVALMIPQVLATLHVAFEERSRSRAFGLYGAVLSLAGVLGPVMGGLLATGLLALGVFLRHQWHRQGDAPFVPLSLFRGRQFPGGLGMSPFHAALAFVLLSLGELAGATIAARSGGRFARRMPQTGALVALASMAA